MGLLDWWRNRGAGSGSTEDRRLVDEAIERIVQTTNPKLRFAPRCRARLAPAVAVSLAYVRNLVESPPPARESSAAAWANDAYLRAFFATTDDLVRAFSSSPDLRAHFDRNPAAQEACVVLNMQMVERKVLGMAVQGDVVRRDVEQTSVSFGDYRIRMCGNTEAELRAEIERRLVDQLALAGLERIAADESQRTTLVQERAMIKARLQLLERQGTGIRGTLGGDAAGSGNLESLKSQLEENSRTLGDIGGGADLLDRELEHICAVLAEPAPHLYVSSKRLRLDRMNLIVGDSNSDEGTELEFLQVRIPVVTPPELRAFAFVRFPRSDLLPAGVMFEKAVQQLI